MMIVDIGYKRYVLTPKNAMVLAGILDGAELYEEKYISGGGYSYHVYPQDTAAEVTLKILPDNLYRMSKLAGKPEKT